MPNSVYVAFSHDFKGDDLSGSDIAFLISVYSTVVVYDDANDITKVYINETPFEPALDKELKEKLERAIEILADFAKTDITEILSEEDVEAIYTWLHRS